MPTMEHNGLVDLFRDKPTLAPHLLTTLFHLDLPPYASVRVADSALDQLLPVEFRADLVLELRDENGACLLAIVLEAQRDKDPRKKFSWPAYLAFARAQRECPTLLLVIAPDADVATWAASPIDLGFGLGTLQPLVIGPAVVPLVTDPAEAEKEPELSILSAMAHGNGENGLAVVAAAFDVLSRLDQEHAAVYFQIIWNVLREPMQRALEELAMQRQTEGKVEFPPFAQKLIARGELKGRLEGELKGELKEARLALRSVLTTRKLALSPDAERRIDECTDLDRLRRWLNQAIVAASTDEALA